MARPNRLTPELRQHIAANVRAGAFPHVAAGVWGIPQPTFDRWLRKGRLPKTRRRYRVFVREVEIAAAQARALAEAKIYQEDSRTWLQHGPGRETTKAPGWTGAVKPALGDGADVNPWELPVVLS